MKPTAGGRYVARQRGAVNTKPKPSPSEPGPLAVSILQRLLQKYYERKSK